MVGWLFLAVPWGCLLFVIVVFPDHTHLLFLLLASCASLMLLNNDFMPFCFCMLIDIISLVENQNNLELDFKVWYLIVSIPDLCTLTYFKFFLCSITLFRNYT